MPSTFVQGPVNGKSVEGVSLSELSLNLAHHDCRFTGLWQWQASLPRQPSMVSMLVCNILSFWSTHTRSQVHSYNALVPIATQRPLPNVHFEMHNVNETFRWPDGTMDLVHARYVAMAVSDLYSQPAMTCLHDGGGTRYLTTALCLPKPLAFFAQADFLFRANGTGCPAWRTVH